MQDYQEIPGEIVLQSSSPSSLAPTQQGLNVTGLLEVIKRNTLPIVGISGIAALILLLTNSSAPTYTGDFQLLVEPVTSEAKFSEPSTLTSGTKNRNISSLEMDYSTIITILRSPGMLDEIVAEVREQYPDFSQKQLRDNLEIARLNLDEYDLSQRTKIIEVSYKESAPDLVNLVLEKTADKYLKYSLEERKNNLGKGIEFIEGRLPDLRNRVERSQKELQNLREQNKFIDPKLRGEDLIKQVETTNLQQLETQRGLKKLKALKKNLESQLNMSPQEAILASALAEDPNYQKLLEKLKSLDSEISTQAAKFQTNTPQMRSLYDEKENLTNLLDREAKRILGQEVFSQSIAASVYKSQNSLSLDMTQQLIETTNKIEQLEIQLASLKVAQTQFENQARQLPNFSRQYDQVTKELAIANQTLEGLITHKDALQIELAQSQVPWKIVSSPQLLKDLAGNPAPLNQNAEKQIMMSLLGSLFIGVGTMLVFEKSRNIFYTAKDIEQQVQSPLLGIVPSHNPDLDHPEFLDAYDALYANLKFRFNQPALRSVVVSPLDPENEIASTALHLAETVAAMGHKVLLVDANLRTPTLHSRLGIANEIGLCDLQVEPVELDYQDTIQKFNYKPNLFVLTAGKILPNSTRMMASKRMKTLNKQFEETFDLVIYDASSFLSYMDTSFLTAHTDGIITVVEVSKTSKYAVRKALARIESFELNHLGAIAISPN